MAKPTAEKILAAAQKAADGTGACCVLRGADVVAAELNTHLKWLYSQIAEIQDHLGIPRQPNPTGDPEVIIAMSAGWGNGNKA